MISLTLDKPFRLNLKLVHFTNHYIFFTHKTAIRLVSTSTQNDKTNIFSLILINYINTHYTQSFPCEQKCVEAWFIFNETRNFYLRIQKPFNFFDSTKINDPACLSV